MEELEDGVWFITFWIPDNPKEVLHQKAKFRYTSKRDALTYGWKLTNEIVEVAQAIVDAVPDKKDSK